MFGDGLLSALDVLLPKYVLTIIYHEDFFLYFTAFLGVVMPSCVYFLYQYIYGIYLKRAQVHGIGLFVISTSSSGREPTNCEWFFDWLEELISTRRCSSRRRCRMRFAVFGYGDSRDGSVRYNRILGKRLHTLGASQIIPPYLVDKRKKQRLYVCLKD
uniref:Flavodoxin-like domain-containing protein n=1 Tax=Syphacia muris TaxID=451379 RepID=A0A0N5AMW7_9BILA